jgi:toxoflavin synthase
LITDYNLIAEQYRLAKQQPWRTHLEAYTFLDLIGDIEGKAVLDLACGEGFYTRKLAKLNPSRLMGVDLSERMIALATDEELRCPLGIDYLVQDGRSLSLAIEFDLVVAAYLLNYARSAAELREMCSGIGKALRPGGRFVTVNCNPWLDFERPRPFQKFGFETRLDGPLREGAPITWSFWLRGSTVEVENYYLSPETYEEALRCAGFREIRWHPLRASPSCGNSVDHGFWDEFLGNPPVIGLECLK